MPSLFIENKKSCRIDNLWNPESAISIFTGTRKTCVHSVHPYKITKNPDISEFMTRNDVQIMWTKACTVRNSCMFA